jgi:pentatricopeptide repeat protein
MDHKLIDSNVTETNYNQLMSILYDERHDDEDRDKFKDRKDNTSDNALIVDVESIIATLDVLGKGGNIPAALTLLRLSVELIVSQQNEIKEDDNGHNRRNELRHIYKAIFSLLGHTYNKRTGSTYHTKLIIHILRHHMLDVAHMAPSVEIYHAAINALGKIGEYDQILEIINELEDQSFNEATLLYDCAVAMSYQSAISSLSRHDQCHKALLILQRMQSKGLPVDTNTYNDLLIGIAKEAGRCVKNDGTKKKKKLWHTVALEILSNMELNDTNLPTEQSYNSVLSACGKEGNWKAAANIAKKAKKLRYHNDKGSSDKTHHRIDDDDGGDTNEAARSSYYFDNLRSYNKVGKGSDSYWEIGRYHVSTYTSYGNLQCSSIIIGIQPHRNPHCNGLSIVFYNDTTASRIKLGRILLKNTSSSKVQPVNNLNESKTPIYHSSLVGMEVNKARRGEGLSKIFIAIWLHICLAAIMNKPLISRVLMDFNFVPQIGGTRVGLIRLTQNNATTSISSDDAVGREDAEESNSNHNNPQFGLYSLSTKSLQGLFSQRYLRVQNIAILDHAPPSPVSRQNETIVYVKTGFEHPIAILEDAVEYTPPRVLVDSNYTDMFRHDNEQGKQYAIRLSRSLLADQIDSILQTTNMEGKTTHGTMDYFANVNSLNYAFLYYDKLLPHSLDE